MSTAPAQGHAGAVTSLCALRLPCGGLLLASTAADSDVCVWRCPAVARELGLGSAGAQRAADSAGNAASSTEHERSSMGAGSSGGSASKRGPSTYGTADGAKTGGACEAACSGSPDPAGVSGIGQGRWALQQAINVGGRMQHAAALMEVPGEPGWCAALGCIWCLLLSAPFEVKGHRLALHHKVSSAFTGGSARTCAALMRTAGAGRSAVRMGVWPRTSCWICGFAIVCSAVLLRGGPRMVGQGAAGGRQRGQQRAPAARAARRPLCVGLPPDRARRLGPLARVPARRRCYYAF